MQELGKQKDFIYNSIASTVFVTKESKRIVKKNGEDESNWIMDFRSVILRADILDVVSEIYFNFLKDEYPVQVGGLEVAAIPIVSGIVMKSHQHNKNINGFFIRKSRKKSGLLNMVEGELDDSPVVLVDDIINSGNSFIRQIEILEQLGKKVKAVFVILRFRDIENYEWFTKRGIKVISLFSLDDFKETLSIRNLKNKLTTLPSTNHFSINWMFKSDAANYEYVVPKSTPVLSDGVLYFGSDNGTFWAIDAATGEIRWSYRVLFGSKGKKIFSSPCVFEDTVYFGAYDGNFYALHKKDGKVKWISFDADWIGSSPCVNEKEKLVYVGMEFGFWKSKGGVAAFDIHTGKRVWQSKSTEYTHGSPTYSKKYKIVICGSNDGLVYGLDGLTGNVMWTYNAKAEVKAKCVLSESEKYVAFSSFNKEVTVLETLSGKVVQIFNTLEINYSSPAWQGDDVLIASSLDKNIYAWNLESGALLWSYLTIGRIMASPVISKCKVFCGGNDARLHVLDISSGKEISLFHSIERITNAVVIDEKRNIVYVTTFANEVYSLNYNNEELVQL